MPEVIGRIQKEHLVRVAFDADRRLCAVAGIHSLGKTWENLSANERAQWINTGPADPLRAELYRVILSTLRHLDADHQDPSQ